MNLKLTLAAALLMAGTAFAAQPGGNPGNQCQGQSCIELPPPSQGCDNPGQSHLMNPHCKPGGPDPEPPVVDPEPEPPVVDPEPPVAEPEPPVVDPERPRWTGRTGARMTAPRAAECPLLDWSQTYIHRADTRATLQAVRAALAGRDWIGVNIDPADRVISIQPDGQTASFAVAVLPDGGICIGYTQPVRG